MASQAGQQSRRTSGPLLDWFYVHGGYMHEEDGALVQWDVPQGIELEVQPATKSEALIEADRPWEGSNALHLCQILPADGMYRMYYRGGGFFMLAESKDGLEWTKPELGLVDFQGSTRNNIIDAKLEYIFEDPSAPSEERWKGLGMSGGFYEPERDAEGNWVPAGSGSRKAAELMGDTTAVSSEDILELQESPDVRETYRGDWAQLKGFLRGSVSPDGLHWTMLEDPLLAEWVDGDNLARYDEQRGKYVGHFRFHVAGRRCAGRSVSDDFRTFSPETVALRADAMDAPDVSLYNYCWTRYPGRDDLDLMFVSIFHQGTGLIDVQLALSHDGLYWDRLDRKTTIIPCGPEGSLDGGSIYAVPDLLALPDGRWALAYSGKTRAHIGGYDTSAPFTGILRYAMWERDRLAGIRAREHGSFTLRQDLDRAPENCPDAIASPPHNRFPPVADPNEAPRQLKLNYRTEPGGWIRTELIPVIGPMTYPQIQPIEGYSFDDCELLEGDEFDKVVTWRGQANIAGLSDTLAVRIRMFRATLFAFDLGAMA